MPKKERASRVPIEGQAQHRGGHSTGHNYHIAHMYSKVLYIKVRIDVTFVRTRCRTNRLSGPSNRMRYVELSGRIELRKLRPRGL